MTRPHTAVIIPNWRRYDLTARLLDELRGEETALDVYVVDNESRSPRDVERLRAHPRVAGVWALEENRGFAGAVNHALRACRPRGYRHYFVLNSDLRPAPGFFAPMLEALAEPDVAFVCPVSLTPDGEVESCGVELHPDCSYLVRHRTEHAPGGELWEADSLHGAAIGFTEATLGRVGVMDEDYFHLWEETDWCTRARQAGLRNVVATRAVARHEGSASLHATSAYHPVIEYMLMRNMLHFLRKRGFGAERVERHAAFWRENSRTTSFREPELAPEDPELAQVVIERAIADFRRGRTGIWPAELWAEHLARSRS